MNPCRNLLGNEVMGTKILATSDLHGHLDLFQRVVEQTEPEIAIVAGDMTDMGLLDCLGLGHGPGADQWSRFCKERPQIDFIMVPGNHERWHGIPSRFPEITNEGEGRASSRPAGCWDVSRGGAESSERAKPPLPPVVAGGFPSCIAMTCPPLPATSPFCACTSWAWSPSDALCRRT